VSLFDQQPFGPIPARKPILMPPDPDLEAATDDPTHAKIELVQPIPPELAGAPQESHRRHNWTRLIALLVLAPMIAGIVAGAVVQFDPSATDQIPAVGAISLVALIAVVVTAEWLWRRRSASR
jgi:hypothetical protein